MAGRHNPLLKELRRAFATGLTDEGCFAIEGIRMIEEATRSGARFRAVFFSSSAEATRKRLAQQISSRVETLEVPAEMFHAIVASESPQGVAALIHRKTSTLDQLLPPVGAPLIVVAAGLQDPGNLGTLLRSADAFGATGVVLTEGTVSAFNPKAVRATAGSIFRLAIVNARAEELLPFLAQHKIRRMATSSHEGTDISAAKLSGPVALFVGNEGAGLPRNLASQMDETVVIPHRRTVESLNAGVAASILLYEAAGQRRAHA
jgi:TrmH family RNA methyltransferase